jgi:hypothetical protein
MLSYTVPVMAVIAMVATVSFGVIAATAISGAERQPARARRSRTQARTGRR